MKKKKYILAEGIIKHKKANDDTIDKAMLFAIRGKKNFLVKACCTKPLVFLNDTAGGNYLYKAILQENEFMVKELVHYKHARHKNQKAIDLTVKIGNKTYLEHAEELLKVHENSPEKKKNMEAIIKILKDKGAK